MYQQARVISAAVALFFLSLVLTAYSVKNPEVGRAGSKVFQVSTGWMQLSANSVWQRISGIWDGYVWFVHTAAENQKLRSELSQLQTEVIRLRELSQENIELRKVLNFKETTGYGGIVASVIGYDPTGWIHTLTIGKGIQHGIREQLPVIQAGAVVGQVSSASHHTAQVLQITDRTSGVAGVIQRSRARGIVVGSGGKHCRFDYIAADEDVAVGDIVVTSGMDAIYPKGLEIGQVMKITREPGEVFQSILIQPSVDFAHLETLFVISPFAAEKTPSEHEGSQEAMPSQEGEQDE